MNSIRGRGKGGEGRGTLTNFTWLLNHNWLKMDIIIFQTLWEVERGENYEGSKGQGRGEGGER